MRKIRVLIADEFQEQELQKFQEENPHFDITYDQELVNMSPKQREQALVTKLPGYHAIMVRSTFVQRAAIEAATNDKLPQEHQLKGIIRIGSSPAAIDTHAAAERGVYVGTTPGKNSHAVAEFTRMSLLYGRGYNTIERASIRARIDSAQAYKEKQNGAFNFEEIFGAATVLGTGWIGGNMASAFSASGLKTKVYSPNCTEKRAKMLGIPFNPVQKANSLNEALKDANILTIHVPLKNDKHPSPTKHMIGSEQLNLLKRGATVICPSRLEVFDLRALEQALREGQIATLILDIPEVDYNLLKSKHRNILSHPHVKVTPDIAAASDYTGKQLINQSLLQLKSLFDPNNPRALNCVNSEFIQNYKPLYGSKPEVLPIETPPHLLAESEEKTPEKKDTWVSRVNHSSEQLAGIGIAV